MNVYRKKIDNQKVYLRPPNSSARAAPTKYQLVWKQTPTENQTKTKKANQKEMPHSTDNVPLGDNVPAGPVEEQHNTNNGSQDQTPPGY